MICRFCNQDNPKLVKAHIIPRSFYKKVRGEGNYAVKAVISENSFKQKFLQAGEYDEEILCQNCEAKFSPCDNYAIKIFDDSVEKEEVLLDINGGILGFKSKILDFNELGLFVVSLLWRSSITSLPFFSRVSLGQRYENLCCEQIEAKSFNANEISFFCFYAKNPEFPNILLRPKRCRVDGVNVYQFYLPNFLLVIKVDRQPWAKELRNLAMTPDSNLNIFLDPLPSHENDILKIKAFYQKSLEKKHRAK